MRWHILIRWGVIISLFVVILLVVVGSDRDCGCSSGRYLIILFLIDWIEFDSIDYLYDIEMKINKKNYYFTLGLMIRWIEQSWAKGEGIIEANVKLIYESDCELQKNRSKMWEQVRSTNNIITEVWWDIPRWINYTTK